MKKNKIDIVYTWVSDKDSKWLKKKNKYLNIYNKFITNNGLLGRFNDNDELKYSIRSVLKNMKWINKIYVVTDDQIPSWLKKNKKIIIVDHSEIIPKKILPVFNSLLIELFINKIPGLSNRYIYFNDDFFINKELKESDFFIEDKCVRYITEPVKKEYSFLKNINDKEINKLFNSRNFDIPFYKNSFDLHYIKYRNIDFEFYLKHIPYAFNKKEVKEILNKYEKNLLFMYENKFRGKNDLMLAYLLSIDEFVKKKAIFRTDNNDLFELCFNKSNKDLTEIFEIWNSKYKFISFSEGEKSDELTKDIYFSFLNIKYNKKNKYEKKYSNKNDYYFLNDFFKKFTTSLVELKNIKKEKNMTEEKNKLNIENKMLKNEINDLKNSKIYKIIYFLYVVKYHLTNNIFFKKIIVSTTNDIKNKSFFKIKKNSVNVITPTFYDYEGKNYFSGGAERYIVDLYEIFKKNNIELNLFQFATSDWHKIHNGINVYGISVGDGLSPNDKYTQDRIVKKFKSIVLDNSILTIYSPYFINTSKDPISIGISHGISWDGPKKTKNLIRSLFSLRGFINSVKYFDKVVSVDTNTPKWIQTIDYKSGLSIKYIPNYADLKFFNENNIKKLKNNFTVLYPRRFYEPRGLYLAIDAADKILSQRNDVDFHFVGRGYSNDVESINKLINKYPNNVKMYSLDQNDMYKAYKEADISIIPTLYSEGTSLSLIEAMASGNVVIATRVGGLTDLVIDNFNGLLIEPNSEALIEALIDLIDNKKRFLDIRKNSILCSKQFSKDKWEKRWLKVIKDLIFIN